MGVGLVVVWLWFYLRKIRPTQLWVELGCGNKHKPFTEAFRLVLPIIFLLIGQLDVYLVPQNLKATGTDHCIHQFLLFSLSHLLSTHFGETQIF